MPQPPANWAHRDQTLQQARWSPDENHRGQRGAFQQGPACPDVNARPSGPSLFDSHSWVTSTGTLGLGAGRSRGGVHAAAAADLASNTIALRCSLGAVRQSLSCSTALNEYPPLTTLQGFSPEPSVRPDAGRVAQRLERLPYKRVVASSSLVPTTGVSTERAWRSPGPTAPRRCGRRFAPIRP